MADYKYTKVSGKIPELFNKLRTTGIPSKANTKWLQSIGFTSSNDHSLRSVLKFIDFIDSNNTPTEYWKKYRGANHKQILGEAIEKSYSELFEIYEDAHERSDSELENFFRTRTTSGEQVIKAMVATFKALCSEAEFKGTKSLKAKKPNKSEQQKDQKSSANIKNQLTNSFSSNSPSVHIDIQIHISPESTSEQIDNIFASMAKHLYKSDD